MTRQRRQVDARTVDEYRASQSEREFERAVVEFATLAGFECFHVNDARRFWPGYPDWTAFAPGRIVWFELKRAGETLRPAQATWQARIRASGGEAYVWRPEDWDEIERTLREDQF